MFSVQILEKKRQKHLQANSHCDSAVTNLLSMRMWVWFLDLLSGLTIPVCLSCGLDLVLLWLWHRLTAAALIRPLAWELSYATSAALKRKKRKNEWKKEKIEPIHPQNEPGKTPDWFPTPGSCYLYHCSSLPSILLHLFLWSVSHPIAFC